MLAAAAVVLVACGGDDDDEPQGPTPAEIQAETQEAALADVCTAALDIEERVGELASVSILSASLGDVQGDLTAIGKDVATIADSAGGVRESERDDVQQAAESLESSVTSSVDAISDVQSIPVAAAEIALAVGQIGGSVEQLLAPIDC